MIRRFAVVGSPIAHSLSPVLHRAAYDHLGVEDARYDAHDVSAGELAAFLTGEKGRDLRGLSVTMPLKPEASDLASSTDPTAQRLGIANTLLRLPDASWRAENHDVHGIVAALADHGVRRTEHAAVVGSGATALAAVAAVLELGPTLLTLTARRPERLAPLAALAERTGTTVRTVPWEHAQDAFDVEVLVSALAAPGAAALAARLGERGCTSAPAVLLDVLYDPWPAPLAALLAPRGTEVVSGLEMLVHQAERQVASMLGIASGPVAAMRRAAEAEIARRGATGP